MSHSGSVENVGLFWGIQLWGSSGTWMRSNRQEDAQAATGGLSGISKEGIEPWELTITQEEQAGGGPLVQVLNTLT